VAHPAEWRVRVVLDGLVVDVRGTGGDAQGHLKPGADVGRHDAQVEPVFTVCRQIDGFAGRGERDDRGDGAEDLAVVCGRAGTGAGEDRGAVEEPVVRAADAQRGACRDAAGDQGVDLVPLAFVDDRAEIDVVGGGVADGEAVGRGGQLVRAARA
jgi:hypothetical protein